MPYLTRLSSLFYSTIHINSTIFHHLLPPIPSVPSIVPLSPTHFLPGFLTRHIIIEAHLEPTLNALLLRLDRKLHETPPTKIGPIRPFLHPSNAAAPQYLHLHLQWTMNLSRASLNLVSTI